LAGQAPKPRRAWLSLAFLRRYLLGFGEQALIALLSLIVSLWLIRRGAEGEFGAYVFWASAALLAVALTTSLTSVHLYRLPPHAGAGRRATERSLLSATLLLALAAALITALAVRLLPPQLGLPGAILLVPGTLIGFYARALAVSRAEVKWAALISLIVFGMVLGGLAVELALGLPATAENVLLLTGAAQALAGGAVLVRLSAGARPGLGRAHQRRWAALLRRSGWPLAGALASEISTRLYVFLVAASAGTTAMAALAAAQTLLRPATLLAGAWAAAARSALAAHRHEGDMSRFRRVLRWGAIGPAVATLTLGLGLAAFWPLVSAWVFAGRYPDLAGTVLLWTVNMAIACFVFSHGVALQALGQLRAAAQGDLTAALVTAVSMPLLLWMLPPSAALLAMIFGGAVQLALQRRALGRWLTPTGLER